VCAFALRLTGDRHRAEDAAQETLARALKSGVSMDLPYLFQIALNFVRDEARRAENRLRAPEDPDTRPDARAADPAEAIVVAEEKARVWEALGRMPEREREALVLRFGEGLSCAEVAAVLQTTTNAVACLLHRSKDRMILLLSRRGAPR